jgi:glutaredoxin-related protein
MHNETNDTGSFDTHFGRLSVVASAPNVTQSVKLREAIKEYEANKWKVIGQKAIGIIPHLRQIPRSAYPA